MKGDLDSVLEDPISKILTRLTTGAAIAAYAGHANGAMLVDLGAETFRVVARMLTGATIGAVLSATAAIVSIPLSQALETLIMNSFDASNAQLRQNLRDMCMSIFGS
jgi:hypothetical protein